MANAVKKKLARGEVSVGGWCTIGHPVVVEIMAQAGYDWIALDMEHGVIGWPQAVGLMQAIQGSSCVPLCRLPINDPVPFKLALDGGAQGVIVPLIRTAEEACQAVANAMYPPEGTRGVGVCRAHGYGPRFREYVEVANTETLVVLMVEHVDAVNNAEQICAVPGVDAVFVGPWDLSGSMGVMGQIHHPDVERAVAHVLEAASAAGVAPGLHIADPQPGEVARRVEQGFRFIAAGMDILFIAQAARGIVARWRQEGEQR